MDGIEQIELASFLGIGIVDCHITHSNSDITGGLFQLRMKISFPFLLSTVLRRFLLITRPRSFYSPISRGYICTFKVHLLQKYFPHDFSTDSLSCRKKSNLMKKISKRDSDKTERRQCNCQRVNSKENQQTKEQDHNKTSTRQGQDSDNSDDITQQIRLLGHFQASYQLK